MQVPEGTRRASTIPQLVGGVLGTLALVGICCCAGSVKNIGVAFQDITQPSDLNYVVPLLIAGAIAFTVTLVCGIITLRYRHVVQPSRPVFAARLGLAFSGIVVGVVLILLSLEAVSFIVDLSVCSGSGVGACKPEGRRGKRAKPG